MKPRSAIFVQGKKWRLVAYHQKKDADHSMCVPVLTRKKSLYKFGFAELGTGQAIICDHDDRCL